MMLLLLGTCLRSKQLNVWLLLQRCFRFFRNFYGAAFDACRLGSRKSLEHGYIESGMRLFALYLFHPVDRILRYLCFPNFQIKKTIP
jgi:hypothetical protein